MEDKVKNIYQRLLGVMKDVRYIQKEAKTVNNQYRFVSHDAVTAATSEAFINHGIYAKPRIIKYDLRAIEIERLKWVNKVQSPVKETSFICEVEAEYDFINVDNPEDKVCGVNGIGQGIDSQDKAPGKATSYACKYAILKALGIETGDDPEKDVDFKVISTPLQKLAEGADKDLTEKKEEKRIADLKASLKNMGSIEEIDGYLEDYSRGKALKRMSEINAGEAETIIKNAKLSIDPDYK